MAKARNLNNHQPGDRGAEGSRLNPNADRRAREQIKTTMIINRLNNFIEGEADKVIIRTRTTVVRDRDGNIKREKDPKTGKKVAVKEKEEIEVVVPVMSQTQVQAALGLLRKTLPDRQQTTVTGAEDGPVQVQDMSVIDTLEAALIKIGKLKKPIDDDVATHH